MIKMLILLLPIIILANLESTTAKVDSGLKIIGGSEAVPNSFPYQIGIALKAPTEKKGWCGGALISSDYVLTAAHCLKGIELASLYIGAHNLTNATRKVDVTKSDFIIHTKWSVRSAVNDIALIKLPEVVEFGAHVAPVGLPSPNSMTNLSEANLTLTGWGRISGNFTIKRPEVLHEIQLKVVEEKMCSDLYQLFDSTTNICLEGSPERTPCRGDSGGPAVFNDTLVGIVSYGRKCQKPSVLTKVESYLDWIEMGMRTN